MGSGAHKFIEPALEELAAEFEGGWGYGLCVISSSPVVCKPPVWKPHRAIVIMLVWRWGLYWAQVSECSLGLRRLPGPGPGVRLRRRRAAAAPDRSHIPRGAVRHSGQALTSGSQIPDRSVGTDCHGRWGHGRGRRGQRRHLVAR